MKDDPTDRSDLPSTVRGTVGALAADGAPPAAHRPDRTLPLRVELVRQLRRRRTQVAFGLTALLPVLLWVAFLLADDGPPTGSLNLVDLAMGSGTNFATFALFASASFLLVVVVALFFGDTVAGCVRESMTVVRSGSAVFSRSFSAQASIAAACGLELAAPSSDCTPAIAVKSCSDAAELRSTLPSASWKTLVISSRPTTFPSSLHTGCGAISGRAADTGHGD